MTLKEYGIAKNGVLCKDIIICECGTVLNTDVRQCPHCHNNLSKKNLKKVQPNKDFGEKVYVKKEGDSYYFAYEKLAVLIERGTYRLDYKVKYYMNVTKESIEFNSLKCEKMLNLVERELPGLENGIKYLKFTKQEDYKDFSYLAKLYFKISSLFINKSFQDLENLKIINPDHRRNTRVPGFSSLENTILSFFDMYPHIDFNDKEQWPIDMNYIGVIIHSCICFNYFKRCSLNDFFEKIQQHPHKEVLLKFLKKVCSEFRIGDCGVSWWGHADKILITVEKALNQEIDNGFYQCLLKNDLDELDISYCFKRLLEESNYHKININWSETTNIERAYKKLQLLIQEKDNPTNTKKILEAYSLVDKNPLKALETLASIYD